MDLFEEYSRLVELLADDLFKDFNFPKKWIVVDSISLILHNVFNGIKVILKVICNDIDGHVPQ